MTAARLSFGYSDTEDRLVLWLGDGENKTVAVTLTRRLTGRLINSLAGVLERSSAVAGSVPANLRNEMVLMEHQGAVMRAGEREPENVPLASVRLNAARPVVSRIDITTTSTGYKLVFSPVSGDPLAVGLSRADLHRITGVLNRKSQEADWNLQVDAGWLGAEQESLDGQLVGCIVH